MYVKLENLHLLVSEGIVLSCVCPGTGSKIACLAVHHFQTMKTVHCLVD